MTTTAKLYWLPTIACSLIDTINRVALAQGSVRYAQLGADADYNGHHVRVWWNDYKGYWIAEYTWAGRQVLARGSFRECLRAAKREYERGAKGSTVLVDPRDWEQEKEALEAGFQPYSEEIAKAHSKSYQDARFEEVTNAFWYEKHFGVPAVAYLANSATVEEYKAKVDACLAEQRAARGR
jgi:hypothetical protein